MVTASSRIGKDQLGCSDLLLNPHADRFAGVAAHGSRTSLRSPASGGLMGEPSDLDAFRAAMRGHLETLSSRLIAELRAHIAAPELATIRKGCVLNYKVDVARLGSGFPVTLEVADIELTPHEAERRLLPDIAATIPSDLVRGSDSIPLDVIADVFRTWFAECWTAAGGASCRCYTSLYDTFGATNFAPDGWTWTAWADVE